MRSLGNANYWQKVTQGFPPEGLNCTTPSHCRSEPEGTAGYWRTAVEGPVARTVAFNLAIRKSSVTLKNIAGGGRGAGVEPSPRAPWFPDGPGRTWFVSGGSGRPWQPSRPNGPGPGSPIRSHLGRRGCSGE